MIKVILVDDEPFILQGLKVLVDWNAIGCEVVFTASNGKEAYEYLENNQVDLLITDIKMPEMNGLELLKAIREGGNYELEAIILSGYKDFEYAAQGMKYGCAGYVLKPVVKDEITALVKKLANKKNELKKESIQKENMERAFLARNILAVLFGKFDEKNVSYIEDKMRISEEIRFSSIEFINPGEEEDYDESEIRQTLRDLQKLCEQLLGADMNHVVFDTSSDQNSHEIGLILCDYMYKEKKATEEDYLIYLRDEICSRFKHPVRILAGKKVKGIRNLSKSYSTVRILKSVQGFRQKKDIYFYEDEAQVNQG